MAQLSGPAQLPPEKVPEADPARIAGRLRSFVERHGGTGTAVISYLGRPGARIVVVSATGLFADAVVSDMDLAAAVCEAAGIPVGSWDRELTSRIAVTSADRRRMAGTGR
jgi:hypothetical protein